MSKVITFSREFPAYHPKSGQPTYFVEQFFNSTIENGFKNGHLYKKLNDLNEHLPWGMLIRFWDSLRYSSHTKPSTLKYHTIREGNNWKVGDKFSPRVWGDNINPKSGKPGPYQSKQIILGPDVEIKKIWSFRFNSERFTIDGAYHSGETEGDHELLEIIANNDALEIADFKSWFKIDKGNDFYGQIICWNENINY